MDSSAQLPAKYEGEEIFSAKLFFTPNTSHLKESAELCPGCNCPMDETTDYQLVLTRRSSSRFAKIAISSQTNKLPILHVYPSQNSFIMLCFFFWTICVRQKILIFAQPIKTQLSLNICLNNSTSSQTAHLHVHKKWFEDEICSGPQLSDESSHMTTMAVMIRKMKCGSKES